MCVDSAVRVWIDFTIYNIVCVCNLCVYVNVE